MWLTLSSMEEQNITDIERQIWEKYELNLQNVRTLTPLVWDLSSLTPTNDLNGPQLL